MEPSGFSSAGGWRDDDDDASGVFADSCRELSAMPSYFLCISLFLID